MSRSYGSGRFDDDPLAQHRAEFAAALDEMESLHWSLRQLITAMDGVVTQAIERAAEGGTTADEPPEGSFGYVPLDLGRFLAELHALDTALAGDADYALAGFRYRPVHFIELGCGHGRNLAIIRESAALNWAVLAGVDISPRMIELGRMVFGFEDELRVADAMTEDLGAFDVVYTYRPFTADRLQTRFERHLVESMRVGAYLVAPLQMRIDRSRRMQAKGPTGNLFKKIA